MSRVTFLICIVLLGHAASRAAQTAYVALTSGPESISQLSVKTGKTSFSLPTVPGAVNMAITPDGSQAYVLAPYPGGNDTITVFDLRSMAATATIPLTAAPWTIAFSPTGHHAFVTATDGNGDLNLFVIDTQSAAVIDSAVYSEPGPGLNVQVAISPNGLLLYYPQGSLNAPAQGIEVFQLSSLQKQNTILAPVSGLGLAVTDTFIVAATSTGGGVYSVQTSQLVHQFSIQPKGSLAALANGAAIYFFGFQPHSGADYLEKLDLTTLQPSDVAPLFSTSIAVSPDGATAAVGNQLLDLATGSITLSLSMLSYPVAPQFSPDSKSLYVLNGGSSTLASIDAVSGTVTGQVPVGSAPVWLAAGNSGQQLVTASSGSGTVSVIDTASGRSIRNISVNGNLAGQPLMFAAASGNQVYVASSEAVAAYNLQTAQFTQLPLPVTSGDITIVNAVAMSPTGTRLVADVWYLPSGGGDARPAQSPSGNLLVYDTATNTLLSSTLITPNGAIVVDPSGTLAYVDTFTGAGPNGAIQVLNLPTGTVSTTWMYKQAGPFKSMAVSSDGSRLYALDLRQKAVRAIDTSSGRQLGNFPVNVTATAIVVTPDGLQLYVADSVSTSVTTIQTATGVQSTIPVGSPSSFVAVIGQ